MKGRNSSYLPFTRENSRSNRIVLLRTIKGKEITGAANLSTFAEILSIPVIFVSDKELISLQT